MKTDLGNIIAVLWETDHSLASSNSPNSDMEQKSIMKPLFILRSILNISVKNTKNKENVMSY